PPSPAVRLVRLIREPFAVRRNGGRHFVERRADDLARRAAADRHAPDVGAARRIEIGEDYGAVARDRARSLMMWARRDSPGRIRAVDRPFEQIEHAAGARREHDRPAVRLPDRIAMLALERQPRKRAAIDGPPPQLARL